MAWLLTPPLDDYKKNSIYSKNTQISFGGYLSIKPKVSLEYGIENNFFKLPKVKNADGSMTQIMPDKAQVECAKHLIDGKNVLFDAPTGIGKTSVAHFAINKNLIEGKRTIYTVPIKALANDKYNEFIKIYGEKNVGILTGDRKINGQAPIVIQTTEIFNNQAQSMHLNDAMKIGTVVYDEVHYLGDEERGMAWENSIVQAASLGIQILGLSATIGNADELTSWIDSISYTRDTARVAVKPEERPVPLIWHLYASVDSKSEKFYPIMLGEVDLSQDLPDMSQSIVDLIYDTEQMYFEKQHRKEQSALGGVDCEYTIDENYRKEIPQKLANVLGEDWINSDFGDKKVIQKLKDEFQSLTGIDIEQIAIIASKSGVKSLSDRQKRGLEIIFNLKENSSDAEYENAYNTLKNDLEDIKCDSETFRKYLRSKYPHLDKVESNLITQLLSRPDVKNISEIQKGVEEIDYAPLIKKLEKQDKLPAIIFKLSQSACETACESLLRRFEETEEKLDEMLEPAKTKKHSKSRSLDLLTQEEKEEVRKILDRYKKDGIYLGADINTEALLRGWGVHHAGRLPQYKKLIEELFAKKLLKVVFATSTLGAGINMPARTVVMSSVDYTKYNPETRELEETYITSSEFHQMTGRAGRRGIDKIGNVVLYGLTTDEQAAAMKKKGDDEILSQDDLSKGELSKAYELMKSGAEPLESSARPDPVSLVNFYAKHKQEQNIYLWDLVNTSFRYYSAQDKNEESRKFYQELQNYSQVLLEMNYLIPNYGRGGYQLTPKGKILSMSQGINPLLMSSLLCNEKLENITPVQLAQFVGCIQGSSLRPEKFKFVQLIEEKLKIAQMSNSKANVDVEDFSATSYKIRTLEDSIASRLENKGIDSKDIKYCDTFAGMVTYLFASFNSYNPDDSIANFEKISQDLNVDIPEFKKTNREYYRRATEGNIYKIIAGSISTLKQIIKICDFALDNEEDFPNVFYWENLKETAHGAIKLLNKEPINNDPNYAS